MRHRIRCVYVREGKYLGPVGSSTQLRRSLERETECLPQRRDTGGHEQADTEGHRGKEKENSCGQYYLILGGFVGVTWISKEISGVEVCGGVRFHDPQSRRCVLEPYCVKSGLVSEYTCTLSHECRRPPGTHGPLTTRKLVTNLLKHLLWNDVRINNIIINWV